MATSSAAVLSGSDFGPYGTSERSSWLDVDWREHLRWAIVDGDAISYVDIGEGPALVFVHGLSGSWRNWLENILPFSQTHRVIALDLPGFGASPLPPTPISIPRYAMLLDRLLADLGIESAVLVGNSMGGLISLETSLRYPDRVSRLALVSPAGLTTADLYRPRIMAQVKRLGPSPSTAGSDTGASTKARRGPKVSARPRLRQALLVGVAASPRLLGKEIIHEQLKGSGTQGFIPALDAVLSHPIRDRIDQISCPTLLIWGTKDRVIPVRDAAEFDRLLPNVQTVRYPATGHIAMLERPDRFNADLHRFLTA